jgi:hypothetical protein
MRFLPFLLLLLNLPLHAQGTEADLATVNALYDGQVRFKIDKQHRLVADFFDASGHYRQDVAYLEFLDADSIRYTPEEQVVTVRCRAGQDRCFDKELFKLNTIRHSGRMNLPLVAGDPDGERAMATLSDLIRHAQEHLAALDETKGAKDRMNEPQAPRH